MPLFKFEKIKWSIFRYMQLYWNHTVTVSCDFLLFRVQECKMFVKKTVWEWISTKHLSKLWLKYLCFHFSVQVGKEMLSIKHKEGEGPSFNLLMELLRGDHWGRLLHRIVSSHHSEGYEYLWLLYINSVCFVSACNLNELFDELINLIFTI